MSSRLLGWRFEFFSYFCKSFNHLHLQHDSGPVSILIPLGAVLVSLGSLVLAYHNVFD